MRCSSTLPIKMPPISAPPRGSEKKASTTASRMSSSAFREYSIAKGHSEVLHVASAPLSEKISVMEASIRLLDKPDPETTWNLGSNPEAIYRYQPRVEAAVRSGTGAYAPSVWATGPNAIRQLRGLAHG